MTREEVMADGSRFYCGCCRATFKDVPLREVETGHGGLPVPTCPKCGEDLIVRLSDDELVKPEDY